MTGTRLIDMRASCCLAAAAIATFLTGCTQEDNARAKQKLEGAKQDLKKDLNEASREIKKGAHEAAVELKKDAHQADQELKKGAGELREKVRSK